MCSPNEIPDLGHNKKRVKTGENDLELSTEDRAAIPEPTDRLILAQL